MRITLITEGASENRIIKHILVKFFKDHELFFRDAQPQIVNNKQETIGGWNEVLKYCGRTADLMEIFNNTDYLIIQIDTDQSQTKPFDINHFALDNTLKSHDQLYINVVEKLKQLIDPSLLELHSKKIFFAICIHTIECWLLPLYYTNDHKSDTTNCITTLNSGLRKKNIIPIPVKNKNSAKSIRTYETILKAWRKRDDITNSAQYNVSFQNFVDSIKVIDEFY